MYSKIRITDFKESAKLRLSGSNQVPNGKPVEFTSMNTGQCHLKA